MIPADNTHMIVLPGGGYFQHAAHKAEPVATWLTCKRAFSGTSRAARLLSRAQAEVERLPARPRSARPGADRGCALAGAGPTFRLCPWTTVWRAQDHAVDDDVAVVLHLEVGSGVPGRIAGPRRVPELV